MLTAYQANLASVEARLARRPPLFPCDLCEVKPAVYHVHRIEGARVITATVCRECKVEFERGAE